MAISSTPIRIDDDLLGTAKVIGAVQDRSAAQQVTHWARLGREVEASRTISAAQVGDVLAGRRRYDDLATAEDKAAVRAEWTRLLDEDADGIDLSDHFAAKGITTWVDLADDGSVVHRSSGDRG